ncbi:MmpS family transport accessory protein [Kocuria sp.]|uniref:MmpS family transport accessory protein n=1 Tax=Kocuria sp. TaxID=1871328 RepID=UPI0026E076F6|nr:MmpS family transport accessory protein [Kocuria sp.]MDO5619253.1 MmpS family transport accessory protein [Kocuria sp.]
MLVALAVLILGGCGVIVGLAAISGSDNNSSTTQQVPTTGDGETAETTGEPLAVEDGDTVLLEATTTGRTASVHYGPLGTSSTADISGDWSHEVTEPGDETYSVSVQDMSMDDSAEVTCRVTVNGEVVEEKSATGSAAIAICTQPLF